MKYIIKDSKVYEEVDLTNKSKEELIEIINQIDNKEELLIDYLKKPYPVDFDRFTYNPNDTTYQPYCVDVIMSDWSII